MAGKMTRGRQKIKMEKISKESNLMVTFSKRRTNIFKKANELSTLCGVEVAIIVFSHGKKAYCFGTPSVNTLINYYLPDTNNDAAATRDGTSEVVKKESVKKLNKELIETYEQIEAEKKKGDELKKMRRGREENCWWKKPVNELSLQELEVLKEAIEEMKENMKKQCDKLEAIEELKKNFIAVEALEELKKNARKQSENIVAASGYFVGGSSNSSVMSMGTGGHFGHKSTGNFIGGSSSSMMSMGTKGHFGRKSTEKFVMGSSSSSGMPPRATRVHIGHNSAENFVGGSSSSIMSMGTRRPFGQNSVGEFVVGSSSSSGMPPMVTRERIGPDSTRNFVKGLSSSMMTMGRGGHFGHNSVGNSVRGSSSSSVMSMERGVHFGHNSAGNFVGGSSSSSMMSMETDGHFDHNSVGKFVVGYMSFSEMPPRATGGNFVLGSSSSSGIPPMAARGHFGHNSVGDFVVGSSSSSVMPSRAIGVRIGHSSAFVLRSSSSSMMSSGTEGYFEHSSTSAFSSVDRSAQN